ncbi:hypothetical protein L209DRAFT_609479 [Thermothelomyces heterothallicus CBS 203.75]
MGSGLSRPPSPGPKSSTPAGAMHRPPEPASPCDKNNETPLPDPLTPGEARPRAYGLPTPPPSGNPRQTEPPDKQEQTPVVSRPATPPTSPIHPPSPTPSQTLLGTPTPAASFSSSSSTSTRPRERERQRVPTGFEKFCSNCHRPVSRPRKHGRAPHPLPPPPPPPPTRPRLPSPLPCGHRLCRRCTRASLLASLFSTSDPSSSSSSSSSFFAPATCPAPAPAAPPASTSGPCGAPLPLAALGEAATPAEFLAYRAKLRERRAPAADRLYCHDRDGCGVFLLSRRPGDQSESGSGSGAGSVGGSSSSRSTSKGGTWAWAPGAADGGWGRAPPGGPGRTALLCPLCGRRTCKLCGGRSHFGPGACRSANSGGGGGGIVGGEGKELSTGDTTDRGTAAKRRRGRAGLGTKRRRRSGQVDRKEACCSQDFEGMPTG